MGGREGRLEGVGVEEEGADGGGQAARTEVEVELTFWSKADGTERDGRTSSRRPATFDAFLPLIIIIIMATMASTSRSVLGALRLAAPRSSSCTPRSFTTSSARRLADSTSPDNDPDVVESPSRAQPRSSRTPSQEELATDPLETDSLPNKAVPSQQGLFTNPTKAASTTGAAPTRFDDFSLSSFPHWLERPHPILDAVDRSAVLISREAPWGSSVSIYNDEKHFKPRPPSAATIALESSADAPEVESEENGAGGGKKRGGGARSNQTKAADAESVAGITPLSQLAVANLHRQVLQVRRVVRQSGKGKISSMASLIVVGDGKGLVGFGHGKAENANIAIKKAFRDAVRNMDYVPRFEARTIQRSVTGEWGATKVHLRPRPPVSRRECQRTIHRSSY